MEPLPLLTLISDQLRHQYNFNSVSP
jgi:hypothetical protein